MKEYLTIYLRLIAIAVPTEIALYQPGNAALINGLLIGAGAATNAFGPVVGYFCDKHGRHFYALLGGGGISVGSTLMLFATFLRNNVGLAVFCLGYLIAQTGNVIVTTAFQTIVADYGHVHPKRLGIISGIFGIYQLLGTVLSYVAAGVFFRITEKNHTFYIFVLAFTVVSNAVIFFADTELLDLNGSNHMRREPTVVLRDILREWYAAPRYMAWRSVLQTRFLYFYSVGVFSSYGLYYLEDCTNSKDPTTSFTIVALVSMGG